MIPTIGHLRRQVTAAAEPLQHPWKSYDVSTAPRLANTPHPFGRLVYAEGGAVGGKFGDRYLIARGDDHDESILALAKELGFTEFGTEDVQVDEVDAGWFWLFANPGGRTPAEQ